MRRCISAIVVKLTLCASQVGTRNHDVFVADLIIQGMIPLDTWDIGPSLSVVEYDDPRPLRWEDFLSSRHSVTRIA